MKRLLLFLLLTLPVLAPQARAQQPATIRVATYNMLDVSGDLPSERAGALQRVVEAIDPDILVVQEVHGGGGIGRLNILFSRFNLDPGPFIDGPDTDNALLYDSTKVMVIAHDTIQTLPRYTDEWILVVKGTADTIHVFGTHLKAGNTEEDRDERSTAAEQVRQRFDLSASRQHHIIVAGTLNVYYREPAFHGLTFPGAAGSRFLYDPIDQEGNWHSNPTYAGIHTTSPRLRSFGGGIAGGLEDRFDFILLSESLLNGFESEYIAGSYTTFGNDGKHFKDSINAHPNTAVDRQTAQALHDASDHLPVYLDLVFTTQTSGVEERRRVPREMDLSRANEP